MHLNTLEIVNFLFRYSYAILFPIAFFEGPVIAVISGFLVSIGFLSFIPTYLILISANLIGDIVYYLIGRFVPRKGLNKALSFIGVTSEKLLIVEKMFMRDRKKAIIFGKLAHAVGAVFLIAAGIVRIPFDEYMKTGTIIEIPRTILLLLIGYYFGHSLSNLSKTVDYTVIGFILITGGLIVIYFLTGRYSTKQLKKLENKEK